MYINESFWGPGTLLSSTLWNLSCRQPSVDCASVKRRVGCCGVSREEE